MSLKVHQKGNHLLFYKYGKKVEEVIDSPYFGAVIRMRPRYQVGKGMVNHIVYGETKDLARTLMNLERNFSLEGVTDYHRLESKEALFGFMETYIVKRKDEHCG